VSVVTGVLVIDVVNSLNLDLKMVVITDSSSLAQV
jgi:hypothetical protein